MHSDEHDQDGAEAKGLPVAGYKPTQPAWAIEAVNALKHAEERVLRQLDELHAKVMDSETKMANAFESGRWLGHSRIQIQAGFMAAARAIFEPSRVRLPEDDTLFAGDQHIQTDAKGG